ncbi:MAG TPA: TonB-dependent receptor [Bacteroidales bacterium]|nr:TonB-dependent receptor [Bacteroidales bacterium]HPR10745.1 TonB-dependent receptor [Bacteroidales bacterium]HRW85952.1 TonB-dependent receptor [Bacteroidales bacterium]
MKKNLQKRVLSYDRTSRGRMPVAARLLFFLVFFSFCIAGNGIVIADNPDDQQNTKRITGTVTDQSGNPLPGVSIVVKGTSIGVASGVDGRYVLDVPVDARTLVFSFIGYTAQEVEIGSRSVIDVSLAEEMTGLEEVVVVGYGTQKKVNLTGSITAIKVAELTEITVPTLTQAIMGKSPGLFIKNVSGQPGRDNNVSYNIRGFGTPLIIIDGMPATSEVFNQLDPNDIEDFSILKDAAAAAIYGSRAGEGVILVKTKRGKLGAEVTISSNFSTQFFTLIPEFVDSWTYAAMENVSYLNDGKTPPWTEQQLQTFKDGSDPNKYPNTDWWDITLRKYAPQLQTNINIQGGTDKVKYFVSAGYFYQEGMLRSNDTKVNRYNLRSNIDVALTKKLNMGVDLNILNKDYDGCLYEMERGSYVGIMTMMFRARPYYSASWPDPTKLVGQESPEKYSYSENVGYKKQNVVTGDIKLSLDYKLPWNLNAKAIFQVNRNYDRYKQKQKQSPTYYYDWDNDIYTLANYINSYTSIYESIDIRYNLNQQYFLTWGKQLNDHNISALAVFEVLSDSRDYFNAQRIRYDFDLDYLFAGPDLDKTNNGSASEGGRKGLITRINYDYKGKYLLELNSRYDASPRFPKGSRWGFFPSASIGWRLSREPFIADRIPALSNLKLRASYGLLGNDNTGNFQYLETFSMTSQFIFDGSTNTLSKGIRPDALPNKSITWEKMETTNVGFDFGFWDEKLTGSFDYFYRLRSDVLGTRIQSLPNVVGATLPQVNYAKYDNRGFELELAYRKNFGNLDVRTGGNIAWNREKTVFVDQTDYATMEAYRRGNRIDEWTDRFWGIQSDGLFRTQEEIDNWADQDGKNNATIQPGDIRYIDYNGDGKITTDDNVIIGRGTFPKLNYGVFADLSWKGITLSLLVQGAGLYDYNLRNSPDFTIPFYAGNQPITYWAENSYIPENPWYPVNTDAEWPRFRTDATNRSHPNRSFTSDFWLVNGGYVRLKTIEIGYNIPQRILKPLNLKSCKIYVSGYNLFTISPIDFLDPEANTSPGRTFGDYYPPVGTYNAGFVLKF